MFDRMRPGIKPLCDQHHTPMLLKEFEVAGLSGPVFVCQNSECCRAYTSARGYFGRVNDSHIQLKDEQEDCHWCEFPTYLESVVGGVENWRCGQRDCNYSAQREHQPQL